MRSIDWPSVYGKVVKREPSSGKEDLAINAGGQNIYMTNCQGCHGADRRGGIGPELLNVRSKLKLKDFHQLVVSGKGEMPAFAHFSENQVKNIYNYLTSGPAMDPRFLQASSKPSVVTGPVVASGGVPGGQELRKVPGAFPPGRFGLDYGTPYPEGSGVSTDRYFIPPGWGLGFPFIISPPWSTIAAYDLNKGTLKWQVPIGADLNAAEEGGKNTGMLRAQRQGMIVTSTGILFCTGKDGKIYAFDADNGKQLWAKQLPNGTEGLPALYEVGGKHYLVVCATSPVKFGRGEEPKRDPNKPPPPAGPPSNGKKGYYVVFALPDRK